MYEKVVAGLENSYPKFNLSLRSVLEYEKRSSLTQEGWMLGEGNKF